MDQLQDCIIVGGGPGGLTGAIYLGRFRRDVLVLDAGEPRAGWIPCSHNHPGFPDGIGGRALLDRTRAQAERYGATVREGRVEDLARDDQGVFVLATTEGELRARNVLLATGVEDTRPDLPDLYEATQRGVVRWCPVCDAYEIIDKRVGVIGAGDPAAREALFLRGYTEHVALVLIDGGELSDGARGELAEARVAVIETSASRLRLEPEAVVAPAEGGEHVFDSVYPALGVSPRTELARAAGALLDKGERLWVNEHMMTSIPGLYAAGDMVRGLNQISIAQAEAAIAATDIHNRLRAAGSTADPARSAA